jgi:hypothetical protein
MSVGVLKPNQFDAIVSSQMHVFCDASSTGYGSVAYLRLVDLQGKIHCSLLMGKARLAPIKQTTIPRLELTAATVSVRLGCLLLQELDISVDRVFYSTDSTTVLHYIFNQKRRFPIFIANRVQFIQDYSSTNDWRYIDTKNNPADYASRGMSIQEIAQGSKWLSGPDFIWETEDSWPPQPTLSKDYAINEEMIVSSALTGTDESTQTIKRLLEHYSDWNRLKYAVAVYRKMIQILQQRKNPSATDTLDPSISVTDVVSAEHAVLKYVQSQHFEHEIDMLKMADEGKYSRVPRASAIYRLTPSCNRAFLESGVV